MHSYDCPTCEAERCEHGVARRCFPCRSAGRDATMHAERERAATERIVKLIRRFERPMVLINRDDLIAWIQNEENTDD